MRTTRQAKVTRTLLATLVVGTLAACGGGGGGDDGVASLGTDDAAAQDEGDDGGGDDDGDITDAEREDAMLEFTECMRDHGVDMPDPQTGGDGQGPVVMRREAGSAADEEAFQEAQDACDSIMEDAFGDRPRIDPEEQAEMQDNALAYAKCMREHGIDFPDPEFSEGGMGMRLGDGIDPEDPDFIEAEEECEPLLGFEEGEGPTRRRDGGGGSESGPSTQNRTES
jgi:hypothetical protein